MIKRILKIIGISALVVGMFVLLAYEQTHYVRIGHVVVNHSFSVNYYYDFTDATGETYQFITTDIISPYDTVKVVMFNNGTESDITDDIIIDYEISYNENEN